MLSILKNILIELNPIDMVKYNVLKYIWKVNIIVFITLGCKQNTFTGDALCLHCVLECQNSCLDPEAWNVRIVITHQFGQICPHVKFYWSLEL